MDWDAIGAIAELLGAVGVIASLVYLGTQIRHSRDQMSQNTRALRATAHHQFTQSFHEAVMEALTIPDMRRVARLGMADFDQLNEEDEFQFNLWINGVMHRYDDALYQRSMGMLDEDRWQLLLRDLQAFFRMPGIAQWWRTNQSNLSPEFVALVDEILGEDPDRGD